MTDNHAAGIIQAIDNLDSTMSEIMITLAEIADILRSEEKAAPGAGDTNGGAGEQNISPVSISK